jgi:hypothetical protein
MDGHRTFRLEWASAYVAEKVVTLMTQDACTQMLKRLIANPSGSSSGIMFEAYVLRAFREEVTPLKSRISKQGSLISCISHGSHRQSISAQFPGWLQVHYAYQGVATMPVWICCWPPGTFSKPRYPGTILSKVLRCQSLLAVSSKQNGSLLTNLGLFLSSLVKSMTISRSRST